MAMMKSLLKAIKLNLMEDTVMGSLSSGYIARAVDVMPKQGKHAPWNVTNNYLADRKVLKNARFDDGVLKFEKRTKQCCLNLN